MKTLKITPRTLVYSILAFCSVALILALTIWASLDNSGSALKVVEGEVVFTQAVRSEYFVQQDVDTQGVELHAGGNVYTGEALTFTVDNTTAGDKMVEVSHTEDGNYYRAYFPVTYFTVRHFDIRRQPTGFTYDDEGNVTGLIGLQLWAELSGEPRELPRPLEVHNYSTVVELEEEHYGLTVTEDDFGGKIAVISCAGKNVEFYFVEINGSMLSLSGSARVLSFKNEDENGAKLTLFVTQTETNGEDGTNGAEGWYVYERADGTKETFRFAYYLNGWESNFHSSDYYGGISEWLNEAGDFLAQIEGTTFIGLYNDWHRAVLGQ